MITGIDETGDFAPNSLETNYFVAVHIDQNKNRSAQTKYKMTTDIPSSIITPEKVETPIGTLKFNDGFPDQETVTKVYDNLDFQRGTQAYLTGLPIVSIEGVRRSIGSFGPSNQTVLISEQLMDSKSLFLTANTTTPYTVVSLDFKDGPLVLEIPSSCLVRSMMHCLSGIVMLDLPGQTREKAEKYSVTTTRI